jgi:hypothetical protein
MLNAVLARAQRACCPAIEQLLPPALRAETLEAGIIAMFRQEWALAGHTRSLRSIAIVDEAPQQQYLYPEFLLFQQLFQRHGLQAVIADPAELSLEDGVLRHGELAIDLVYNRLTDFALDEPANARPICSTPACSRRTRKPMPCMPTSATWRCSAMPGSYRHWACPRPLRRCCWPPFRIPRWCSRPMPSACGANASGCSSNPAPVMAAAPPTVATS